MEIDAILANSMYSHTPNKCGTIMEKKTDFSNNQDFGKTLYFEGECTEVLEMCPCCKELLEKKKPKICSSSSMGLTEKNYNKRKV